MCEVQKALEYWDNLVLPLQKTMQELSDAYDFVFSSKDFSLELPNGLVVRDHRGEISCTMSGMNMASVTVLRFGQGLPMLPVYNMASPTYIETPSASGNFSAFGSHFGNLDKTDVLNSTITLNRGKGRRWKIGADGKKMMQVDTLRICNEHDIRTRTEELNFELLMQFDEDLIFPFVLNSLCCQAFPEGGFRIHCDREFLHGTELALLQVQRKLNFMLSLVEKCPK